MNYHTKQRWLDTLTIAGLLVVAWIVVCGLGIILGNTTVAGQVTCSDNREVVRIIVSPQGSLYGRGEAIIKPVPNSYAVTYEKSIGYLNSGYTIEVECGGSFGNPATINVSDAVSALNEYQFTCTTPPGRLYGTCAVTQTIAG